jgi:hypothetical protein
MYELSFQLWQLDKLSQPKEMLQRQKMSWMAGMQ